jgi:Na+/H+ antiporter NhaA
MTESANGRTLSGTTAWARSAPTPLREFLSTETGSAAVLLGATLLALAWVNIDSSSYTSLWSTELSIHVGSRGISLDLQGWINAGLMTFFFFVVGLEARREFDMGELRERRRVALPALAGLGGILMPVAIYLLFNAGQSSAHGWGTAMSTDTAFALGMLALVGPHFPERLQAFMLTVVIVDDMVALAVIAVVYAEHIQTADLLMAVGVLAIALGARSAGIHYGGVYVLLGGGAWIFMEQSGVDPVVVGLVMGLVVSAYPAARVDLERASELFREFREQPTAELAATATAGVKSAISPNVRLQQMFHPWTSYAIVPVFALANAGIILSWSFLSDAFTSPITLGILIGYVVGKPLGIAGTAWLVTTLSRGRLRPPVGWAAVAGGGTIAGIGFTVSILIATLVFSGTDLQEAKLGVLSAALLSSLITWVVFRATAMLPRRLRIRALVGSSDVIIDLAAEVDPDRDHIRGPQHAPVTVVEYGDFECPYCGQAEAVVRDLLADFGDARYVWRHLPLNDVHPNAQIAAEASEAAAAQGKFWEMHDMLLDHQGALKVRDLLHYADALDLDRERFADDLRTHARVGRIAEDVDTADMSGVSGTPTFFINGLRHNGAYDLPTLSASVQVARARAAVASSGRRH